MYSEKQLMFGMACFIGGSSLFTVFITQLTHQESWICALLALCLSVLALQIYVRLMHRFPKQSLAEMHRAVYGKYIGFLLNVSYVAFCILLSAVSLRNLGDFFTGYIMPETPLWVILLLSGVTCALACRCGIAVLLRTAFLFFLFMTAALLINTLLLLPNMQLYNFLPILRQSVADYAKGSFVLASVPLGESIVFMFLLPYADKETNVGKSFLWGLMLGGAYILIVFLRDIAALGTALSYLTEPSYEAVRLINLMDIFSRLEIVFAFALIVMRVFKLSILFCAMLRAFADTFAAHVKEKGIRLWCLTVLAVIVSLYAFPSSMSLPEWIRHRGAYIFSVFEAGLPALTLLIAVLRKKRRKETG